MSHIAGAGVLGGVPDVRHLSERRCCTRAKASEMGGATAVELGEHTGLLLDLSAGGIAIQAAYAHQTGDIFAVQFRLPCSEEVIEATGEVVWVDEARQTGLKFIELADTPKRSLNFWLGVDGQASAAGLDSTNEVAAFLQQRQGCGAEQPSVDVANSRLGRVLVRIVNRAGSLTGAGGAAIILRDEEGAICRASMGNAPDVGSRLLSGSSFTGESFGTGKIVLCNDTEKDPRVRRSIVKRLHLRSILIVPIRRRSSIIGVIEVLSSQPSAFNATHVTALQSIAYLLAAVLASVTKIDQGPPETSFVVTRAQNVLHSGATSVDTFKQTPPEVLVSNSPLAFSELRIAVANRLTKNHLKYAALAMIGFLLVGAIALLATVPYLQTTPSLTRANLAGKQPSPAQQPDDVRDKATRTHAEHESVTKSRTAPRVRPKQSPSQSSSIPFKSLSDSTLESPQPTLQATDTIEEQKATMVALLGAAGTAPVLVSGGLVSAVPISHPPPVYPPQALRMGIEGAVSLRGTVGTDGRVRNLRPVQGGAVLTQAALEAVKNWRYRPALLNGVPVETEINVTVNFRR